MAHSSSDFDLVIWGATGFTGRLTAAHVLAHQGVGGRIRWAIAGRNAAKLDDVAAEIARETGVDAAGLPRFVADAEDPASLRALVERTKVVCTTVGPYARYGSPLVELCAEAGTDYCDLTGEVHFMRHTIDAHEEHAEIDPPQNLAQNWQDDEALKQRFTPFRDQMHDEVGEGPRYRQD